MKWRWNIAWRMGLGFGVFILAVTVLLVITRINLAESRALGEEIDHVLVVFYQLFQAQHLTVSQVLLLFLFHQRREPHK